MGRRRSFSLVLAVTAVAFAIVPASGWAATWGVDDTTDTPVGQACPSFTHCSLREAIESAEANPGGDAILISAGTYPLTNGELTVTQDLTVARVGAGAATISGNDVSRIFDVSGSGTDLTLRFLTVTHGLVSNPGGIAQGGAIKTDSFSTLTIESSTVSNSAATGQGAQGGGIYANQLTITTASGSTTGSSISGNTATADSSHTAHGGGLIAFSTLTIGPRTVISGNTANGSQGLGGGVYANFGGTFTQATVSGNTASGGRAFGGGVAYANGDLTLVRSTVSGNSATGSAAGSSQGGGIANRSPGIASLDLQSSTVAGNSVVVNSGTSQGGGIYGVFSATNSTIVGNSVSAPTANNREGAAIYAGSPVTVAATILAENTGSSGGAQCGGGTTVTSSGYNLLGPLGADCTYSAGTGDVTGVTDAGLKALGNYGGLTETVMLVKGSPALDRVPAADGLCTAAATDQRGIPRPQVGKCDSGAVEARRGTMVIFPSSYAYPETPLSGQSSKNFSVSNTGDLDADQPTVNLASPFSATGCTSSIAAGDSCTLGVTFDPSLGGRFAATLKLRSGPVTSTAALTGVGWAPTTAPEVVGTPSVGVPARVNLGRWPGTVSSFTIQWQRCESDGTGCADITGTRRIVVASGLSPTREGYTPTLTDLGHRLRVIVTATSANSVVSDPAATAPSAIVTRAVPTLIQAPKIAQGSAPVVGTRLTADHGQWTGAPESYSFQWVRCDADGTSNCGDISGATANKYKPIGLDAGHTLRVRVIATNPAGDSAPATSAPSGVVS